MKVRYFRSFGLCVVALMLAVNGRANAVVTPPASQLIYAFADDIELSYTVPSTIAGDYNRTFKIAIKYNTAAFQAIAPRYAPIVIYSHGGAEGEENGHINLGQEWTDELFKNGFLTINIEHAPVHSTDEQVAVCENVNLNNLTATLNHTVPAPPEITGLSGTETLGGDCIYFHATQYLRYHDIEAVLDYLNNTLATDLPEVADQWNGKLALMGHSAGSGAVMHYAGATRTYLCPTNTYVEADPTKFDAYVALSPQSHTSSPHYRGYAATIDSAYATTAQDPAAVTAWDNINQPILNIT